MVILLDIDGVLVSAAPWRKVELLPDGFVKFDETASRNLATLIAKTSATIVLSTTHRVSYTNEQWVSILRTRGIFVESVSKINEARNLVEIRSRHIEVSEWVNKNGPSTDFIIIDDDTSLNQLPDNIKKRWVATAPLVGFNHKALATCLELMNVEE